jgi:hypothetical protein
VIEQIGHDGEEDAPRALPDLQRRRDREVRLADADAAAQVEPALRIAGELPRRGEGFLGTGTTSNSAKE